MNPYDILTDLQTSNKSHQLFDKNVSQTVKFHKYAESKNDSQIFKEIGTLNVAQNCSKEVLDTNFVKNSQKKRILINWFLGTYSSPKNYAVDNVINELYDRGYSRVTYDVTKIKTFEPNWFQRNILRQNSFQYFDYDVKEGFLFEVDDKEIT
jgi:hypothetical protein